MVDPVQAQSVSVLLTLVAIAVALAFPITRDFERREDKIRYYKIQLVTLFGAVVGAKLGVVFGDALWPLQPFDDWAELLVSGRSLAGAVLLGFIVSEAAKPALGYDIPPNDRFAIVFMLSVAIGRVGCHLAGCCLGLPHDGPLALADQHGVLRHPAPLYEVAFHLAAAVLLYTLWRRGVLFGRLFALYLVLYGVFRFFTEFLRETPKAYWEHLSAYQLMALLMILCGGIAIWRRTVSPPDSWARWRAAIHARSGA